MSIRARIPLEISHLMEVNRYLTVQLKTELKNERSVYGLPPKLLVVSDMEGGFDRLHSILRSAKVIDRKMKWIFGDGHLVVLGNCFNEGEYATECLWLIYSLEEKARKAGGYVHYILGDHEIINLNGNWRYLPLRYAKNVRKEASSYLALYDGCFELWRWLKTKNIIEKIGDMLFVHGGVSRELNDFNVSIEQINSCARKNYSNSKHVFTDSFSEVIFNENSSPFCYTGYYGGNATSQQVDCTLNIFDVKAIVTGNKVVDQITSFFDGKVINVNVDRTSGNYEGLFIYENCFFALGSDGRKKQLA